MAQIYSSITINGSLELVMQRFHVVLAYYKDDNACDLSFEETWAKTERECLSRAKSKVPQGGKLSQAWLSEWQNPDACMELLYGPNAKEPEPELKTMVEKVVEKRVSPVMERLSKSLKRMLTKPPSPPPLPIIREKDSRIKRATKPFQKIQAYWAISWRDVEKSNG